MKTYLANAFSLQMVKAPCSVKMLEVETFPAEAESCVGHADTAAILGVTCNRKNIILEKGDILYVAQLQGGRLPEGTTVLPEGFSLKFIKVELL
ncbi:MAG: hypothetical protein LBM08_00800 [Dysgonamonadaceae bacterium]|jgi:hypothetical protein|nr:hypothetical protein [Dysgonamonadaceae bacterium]